MAEAREAQLAATEARERAAAAVLVQGYVAELLPAVLAGLRDQGYLMERIERGIYRSQFQNPYNSIFFTFKVPTNVPIILKLREHNVMETLRCRRG